MVKIKGRLSSMYDIQGLKIELIVNGKKLRCDIPLDSGRGLLYEDVFDYLSDLFHNMVDEFDERIYDEIDVPDRYGVED